MNNNKDKIKIGQKGLIKTTGNMIRYDNESKIRDCEITKIGTKYFTVSISRYEIQFAIQDLKQKTDYAVDYIFYFDQQHLKDTEEKEVLDNELKKHFDYYKKSKFNLEQLRAIKKIIEGE